MSDVETVQGAISEIGKTFEEFKQANDQRLSEIESKGSVDPVTEEKFQKIDDHLNALEDVNQKLTKSALEQKDVNDRIDKLETELKRPSVGIETQQQDELLKTYDKYLRKGKESLDEMETKVLTVSNDTGGGYLAPPEYVREIV